MLLTALGRLTGKRLLIKLTAVGHDDLISMQRRGGAAFWFYRGADCFVGVSPRFAQAYREAGLPVARFRLVANAVDSSALDLPNRVRRRRCAASSTFRRRIQSFSSLDSFTREAARSVI